MCGIAGIVNRDPQQPADVQILARITETLAHRGPDDCGSWTQGHVGFGHRRLSVIDLASGHQPMAVDDGRLWITYNGELYNYIELRRQLRDQGRVFATQSDTEVLLQMYAGYGEECLGQLNGMFAFALWDDDRQKLFAARDRLGIKPFYYYCDDEALLFASEIKALLAHPRVRPELDGRGLQDYLDLQYCLGDKTLFKHVKRLPPGHCLTWEAGRVSVRAYWDMDFTVRVDGSEEELVERLAGLLEDAVRLQLRSDVPVGTHLSGGMDSSGVACLAARLLPGRLHVFTGGFRESRRYDESRYARLVAEQIGAVYHEVFPTAQDLAASFADLVYFLDEPVAGAAVFPQYYLSKLASEHVKVVLGGQGGDEVFCGYARYLVAYLDACLQQAVYGEAPMLGGLRLEGIAPALTYLRGYEPMMQTYFGGGMFAEPAGRYYRLLRRSQDMERLLQPGWQEEGYSTHQAFHEEFMRPRTENLIDRMLYLDIRNHLQSLLHLEDRTSMAVSLESRLPLLDHRLVELVFAAPVTQRFANGQPKYLLRRALAGTVPQPILDRRDKMGFPVPIFEWFEGELRGFVEDVMLGPTARQRGLYDQAALERCLRSRRSSIDRTVWGLLSLELWFRCFFDRR